MSSLPRKLTTRHGDIHFPAYIPVTTFGGAYPLDELVQPYLSRLAHAAMVSYHYACQMTTRPRLPLLVDSGGFVSLFNHAQIVSVGELGVVKVTTSDTEETIHPRDVLDLQENIADVAFTLDFPVPPGMSTSEAQLRQRLTIANARWALANRRRKDLPLYACIQAWDKASAKRCARSYAGAKFDGIAIGGLVPRVRDKALVRSIVETVRDEVGDLPLHVFGLGNPDVTAMLFKMGVDSVDSSSYVKLAADGRLWSDPKFRITDPTPVDRLHLALCNLAAATGRTLPLSTTAMVFSTHTLTQRAARSA